MDQLKLLNELRDLDALQRLREITRILREPGGCDWDRAQDFHSMRDHLIEEASELIDAINQQDFDNKEEELGDVLFMCFFFARLGEEGGHFDIESAARRVGDKLIRRHPHVFADVQVDGVKEILQNWEAIKAQEKESSYGSGNLDGGSDGTETKPARRIKQHGYAFLPALARAQKVQHKAAEVGFDWPDLKPVLAKVHEELTELEAELDKQATDSRALTAENNQAGAPQPTSNQSQQRIEEELGDLLFSVVNLARHLNLSAEVSLMGAVQKFIKRFHYVEDRVLASSRDWQDFNLEELDMYWNEIRRTHQVSDASPASMESL